MSVPEITPRIIPVDIRKAWDHQDHHCTVAFYGLGDAVANIAIECLDCSTVIGDLDLMEPSIN